MAWRKLVLVAFVATLAGCEEKSREAALDEIDQIESALRMSSTAGKGDCEWLWSFLHTACDGTTGEVYEDCFNHAQNAWYDLGCP